MTLIERVPEYLTERVARGELDPMTARNHRSALNRFAATVGSKPVVRLSQRDIELWMETRAHLRPSTRRSQFSYVVTFCGWLQRRGYVHRDPSVGLKAPRQSQRVPRALDPESVAKTLKACPDSRGRAIVWLMVGEGLRCCEVSNLELEDWDRHAQHLMVRGKRGSERVLPVPAEVAQAIEEYLNDCPASRGPLIRSRRSETALKPDTIGGMVSEWMRAAGVKRRSRDGMSAHAFRHTAASDVLDACNDLRVVQQMLGHENLTTTTVYLRRASMGKMRDAMAGRTYGT